MVVVVVAVVGLVVALARGMMVVVVLVASMLIGLEVNGSFRRSLGRCNVDRILQFRSHSHRSHLDFRWHRRLLDCIEPIGQLGRPIGHELELVGLLANGHL